MATSKELTTKKLLTLGKKRYGEGFKEAAAWIAYQLLDSEDCYVDGVLDDLRDIWWEEYNDEEELQEYMNFMKQCKKNMKMQEEKSKRTI